MSLLRKLEYRSCEELERENPSLTGTAGKEGMNPESIRKLQHLGATLILSVGQNLGLSIIAVHTAVFYFHRFYAQHKFQEQDRLQVTTACLFLGSKVEEQPKPLQNVIRQTYSTRYRKHPSIKSKILKDPKTYEMIKERILVVERSLLYTVGFDFNVDTPYKYLVSLTEFLEDFINSKFPFGKEPPSYTKAGHHYKNPPSNQDGTPVSEEEKAEWASLRSEWETYLKRGRYKNVPQEMKHLNTAKQEEMLYTRKVRQGAWNFSNDSLRTTICLQLPPVKIAVVCFYLSMKLVDMVYGNCFGALHDSAGGGKPEFHKLWCDMMNYVSMEYATGDPQGKNMDKVNSFNVIKKEAFTMPFEEIQMCVKQIAMMYGRLVTEEGEIMEPIFKNPEQVAKALKEEEAAPAEGNGQDLTNGTGKREFAPTSPELYTPTSPASQTPYTPTSPHTDVTEGTQEENGQQGDATPTKKQKVEQT